ncbi:hypothetical protein L596_015851 [Steinernema carpocapsae]|uniref:Poly(A) RNA polymerase mitochondrial-like central palm domain-containing protein n=1 Tax=Steinernema carpocapsae TaxID=34508 RepID=A0A4V6A3A2_STECR|nr:hypothetical protein L596_015851 [Steinernema carpocapsae]
MNQAQKERYAENYGVVLVPEETSARVFNDVDSFKGRCPEILQEIEEKITDYARNYAEDEQDIRMKTNALNKLQAFIRDIFPEAILKQVGSTITKLSTKKSDMDLCLVVRDGNGEFDQSHSFALHTLQVLYDELCDERPDMISFHKFIDSAVVPIVKIYLNDEFADLEVDINCNVLPVFLSNHLVLHYVTFDPRVQPLILAIKRWAKNLQVSASQKGGLNSFSFVMMAIHFLQSVCFPMILPNFWKMFPHTFDDNAPVNLRRDLSHAYDKHDAERPKHRRTVPRLH